MTDRSIADRLTDIYTWMREPDWTEEASLEWLKDWINRRPVAELGMVSMLMPQGSSDPAPGPWSRDGLAQIIASDSLKARASYVQGFTYEPSNGEPYHVIRDVWREPGAQELFRTNDREQYEHRIQIEKAAIIADAILAACPSRSAAIAAEPIAWRWKWSATGPWIYASADVAVKKAPILEPLYAAPTTSPEPDHRVYICYDGYGHHYASRDPANHVMICYDQDCADELVDHLNRERGPISGIAQPLSQNLQDPGKLANASPEPDAVREEYVRLKVALRDLVSLVSTDMHYDDSESLRAARNMLFDLNKSDPVIAALSRPAHGVWEDAQISHGHEGLAYDGFCWNVMDGGGTADLDDVKLWAPLPKIDGGPDV